MNYYTPWPKIKKNVYNGLVIPKNLECNNQPLEFLVCWHKNWLITENSNRYYCLIWGRYRGGCILIDQKGD